MNAQPGWYPDDTGTTRYWDGQSWTGHTMEGPATSTPQSEAQPGSHAQPRSYAQPASYAPPVQPQAQVQPGPLQPYAYQQPGAYPQQGATGSNGVAVAGFVVGLVSVFLPLIFGLAAGITGLILSIVGLNRVPQLAGNGKGLAIAGIVLSAIGILVIL